MLFMIRLLFTAILFSSMCADTFFNGSRPASLFPEISTGLWFMAFALAWSPPLLSFFGRDDQLVGLISLAVACVSLGLSIISGQGTMGMKENQAQENYSLKAKLEKRLATDYSDIKMSECRRAPSSVCRFDEMRSEKKEIQSTLDGLQGSQSPTLSKNETQTSFAILIAMSMLPLISLAASRILAIYVEIPEPVRKNSSSRSSRSSQPRNREPEPKKKPLNARKKPAIPTDEQHIRLKKAYQAMRLKGEKVTADALQKRSGVRKSHACWWLKNTDLETIAGTEMVVTGKRKLEIVK